MDRLFLAIAMLCGLNIPQCDILQSAQLVVGATGPGVAAYSKPRHVVVSTKAMTWPIQDLEIVLVHEGQHLLDFESGLPFDCNLWERRAVEAQLVAYRRLFPLVTDVGPGGFVVETRAYGDTPVETESEMFDKLGVSPLLIAMMWKDCE